MLKEPGVKVTLEKASARYPQPPEANIYQASTVVSGFSPRTGREEGSGPGHIRRDVNIRNVRIEVGDAALFFMCLCSRDPVSCQERTSAP